MARIRSNTWQSMSFRSRSHMLLWSMLLLLAACESPVDPNRPASEPDIRHLVVGNALANLNAAGRFVLAPLTSSQPLMTPAHAVAIAENVTRQLNTMQTLPIPGATGWREDLERGLGRTIDWSLVRTGPRPPFPIHTYVAALPDSLPPPVHNHWGPQYVVPLFLDGIEVGAIGVAANSQVRIAANGGWVAGVGNDFRPIRLPYGPGTTVVISAEPAVKFAAERLGARVSEVPYLLKPGNSVAAHLAPWVLKFERPVSVRRIADGKIVETATVYVGQYPSFTDHRQALLGNLRMFVPAPEQPTEERIVYSDRGQPRELFVPIRKDAPVDFVEVEAVLP